MKHDWTMRAGQELSKSFIRKFFFRNGSRSSDLEIQSARKLISFEQIIGVSAITIIYLLGKYHIWNNILIKAYKMLCFVPLYWNDPIIA